jgi:hypothetical protein
MSEKLQRFQARAGELARSGKFNGWRPIAFELQFEGGFTEAIQWTYSASAQEDCRESRKRFNADPSKGNATGSSDQDHPSKFLGTFPTVVRFSRLTGRDSLLGNGGRIMVYALGGILLLVGVMLYATVETGFDLRRDQQQLKKTERGSGADRPRTLSEWATDRLRGTVSLRCCLRCGGSNCPSALG